jgi:alcohol dehydrogenase class IV
MSIASFKSAHRLITGQQASSRLSEEILRLGMRCPMVVTDPGVLGSGTLKPITDQLDVLKANGQLTHYRIFSEVSAEPEVHIVEDCMSVYLEAQCDGLIALGGGSAMDIAKCVAVYATHDGDLESLFGEDKARVRGAPLIAMPTTAGTGSEVTNIGILSDTEARMKKGIVNDYLLPDVAIVAPELTVSCPRHVTAASGVDALVHAIEAYLSNFATPITDALAIKAMRLIIKALPKAYANPGNLEAREAMATGSLLAGMAFGNAGVGAVHALAYPLGGRYHLPHGVTNALLLPHVMRWNALACVERFRDIAEALDTTHHALKDEAAAELVVERLHQLCRDVDIPSGLRHFDISEKDIPSLAADAVKVERLLRNNPRQLTQHDIECIYRAAW